MRKGSENQIIQFLLDNGKIRGAIIDSTRLVADAIEYHGLGPVEALIAGQFLTAASLLTVTIKGGDRMRLSVECGGPIGGWSVDFNADGDVRGSLQNNPIVLDSNLAVTIDNLYGPGFMHIDRYLEAATDPFTGVVELQYPDLATNLAWYYLNSEQTPTAFSLSVDISPSGELKGAAGLFLQVLPGADEETLNELQELVTSFDSLSADIKVLGDGVGWIEKRLADFSPAMIGLKDIRFLCPCSKAQIQRFLIGLGQDKSNGFKEEGESGVHVKCHGCSQEYFFSEEELTELFSKN